MTLRLPPPGSFALHLLDVGQGEAILLDLPNNAFALIDGGPPGAQDMILPLLSARRSEGREFRFAAFTHWDADHIGGLIPALRALPPVELFRPSIDYDLIKILCSRMKDRSLPRLIDEMVALEATMQVQPIGARGSIRDLGSGVEIYALAPGRSARDRVSDAVRDGSLGHLPGSLIGLRNCVSLVLWIKAFGRALLLPGEVDADMAGELNAQFGRISGRVHEDPRAEWIKLAHHGSQTGTSSELVRYFAHDQFVASASHGARYDHPHPRVLQIVRQGGGRAMCTRLGKGCRRIQEAPVQFPRDDPSWTEQSTWKTAPAPREHCYGTITVTVHPDGSYSIGGAVAGRPDCPFGGPANGTLNIPPLR